jgi:hypothetical protein
MTYCSDANRSIPMRKMSFHPGAEETRTHVAVEEPCSWIISSPAQYHVSGRRDGDGISPGGVALPFYKRRVDCRVV